MTKGLKILFIIFSAIAFGVTCIWYYQDRTWEPLAGIFVSLIAFITSALQKINEGDESINPQTVTNTNTSTQNVELHVHGVADSNYLNEAVSKNDLERRKKLTNILFVDDDTKFKVVSILKTAGWIYTKAIKDIANLDEQYIKDAQIIFVDIQGVGKLLQTKDEGLGLALNLKRKYPEKKIVIYSAQTEGNRFHEALRKADAFLAKNAEPYEFLQIVEQYSEEVLR